MSKYYYSIYNNVMMCAVPLECLINIKWNCLFYQAINSFFSFSCS